MRASRPPIATAPSPGLPPGLPAPSERSLGKPAILMGFWVFLFTAPMAEFLTVHLGFNTHIVMITEMLVIIAFVFSGRLGRFLTAPIAKYWIGLFALLFLASGVGMWRRVCLTMILTYGILFHIMPFFCCAIAVTTRQVRHVLYWAIAGFIFVLVACWRMGQVSENRFSVPDIMALANPNDLAFALLFGGTFVLLLVYKRSVLSRMIWSLALPLMIWYALKTGSRANFLTLLFLTAVVLLLSPRRTKLTFLLLAAPIASLLAFTVPVSTWQRLTLIVSDPGGSLVEGRTEEGAVGSQMARTELQKRAVQIAIRHPLLGVGPFMFENAVEEFVQQEEGHKSTWQGPHNDYLRIASEAGVPALILFVSSIVLCFKMNYRSYKMLENDPGHTLEKMQSFCLLLASCCYAFGILFCNVVYYPYLSLLVSFSTANHLAVQKELGAQTPIPSNTKTAN